jgi:hypothetical protein
MRRKTRRHAMPTRPQPTMRIHHWSAEYVSTPAPKRPSGSGFSSLKPTAAPLMPSEPPVTSENSGVLTLNRMISAAAMVTMLR